MDEQKEEDIHWRSPFSARLQRAKDFAYAYVFFFVIDGNLPCSIEKSHSSSYS